MIDRQANIWRLIFALVGGAIASLIAFLASPISIALLGELKFAQLSIWIIIVTFVQILDFGFSQNTIRMCAKFSNKKDKEKIIKENNSIFILLVAIISIASLFVPKPTSQTYQLITDSQWIIFKLSIAFNIKLVYNQNALIIINKQHEYTLFQIFIAILRFIIPIIVYYISNNFTIVLIYFALSTIIIVIILDYNLGISIFPSLNMKSTVDLMKNQIRSALHIYTSGAMAIAIGVFDRILASYFFDASTFANYSFTFTVSSAVNILVLPFYRFFVAGIHPSSRVYNQKNALRISALQSYACLLAVGVLCLYSPQLVHVLGLADAIDVRLLVIITLSLWGAANGWIVASEIMLHSRPAFQAKLMAVTMLLYFVYLALRKDIQPFDLAMIWAMHGVIQTFVCPIWMSDKFNLSRYALWMAQVVFKPSLVVGSIVLVSYHAASLSMILSFAVFAFGTTLVGAILVRKGFMAKVT
jgi:O-antigen/teichoic acid export membrane protein